MFSKVIAKICIVASLGFSLLGLSQVIPSVSASQIGVPNSCVVNVKEYTKSNGKKVKDYARTCKDKSKMNNKSCKMKKRGKGYLKKCY